MQASQSGDELGVHLHPHMTGRKFWFTTGTAELWIKEGKQATCWTRLSCHRFRANEVRLQLTSEDRRV
jgi:hypothetical protein